eukprot:403375372
MQLNQTSSMAARQALKEKLIEKFKQKTGKSSYTDIFLTSKNPKKMLLQFKNVYDNDLAQNTTHSGKMDFRAKFFRETLQQHLQSKQYKRRKNAFYILNYLVQTDVYFAETALKEFNKIKNILYSIEDLPNLSTLEETSEYLKFKVFINSKILEWIDKYSGKFPDLYIWKKSQSQFFFNTFLNNLNNSKNNENEKFEEKYASLKVYRLYFERDQKEVETLKHDYSKTKFEAYEARKLMERGNFSNEQESIVPNQAQERQDFQLRHANSQDTSLLEEEKVQISNSNINYLSANTNENQVPNNFEFNLDEFVDQPYTSSQQNRQGDQGLDHLLFYEEQDEDSTQLDNQGNIDNNQNAQNIQSSIDSVVGQIQQNHTVDQILNEHRAIQLQDLNKFELNTKNKTLFGVIQDNLKTLDRRIIPLLESFRLETAYFKEIQSICVQAVQEKKQQDAQYQGRIKITKKQVQEFEKDYRQVSDMEIQTLQREVEILIKSAQELKKDLELIQLVKSNINQTGDQKGVKGDSIDKNEIVIVDEDDELFEDPDDKLFQD